MVLILDVGTPERDRIDMTIDGKDVESLCRTPTRQLRRRVEVLQILPARSVGGEHFDEASDEVEYQQQIAGDDGEVVLGELPAYQLPLGSVLEGSFPVR